VAGAFRRAFASAKGGIRIVVRQSAAEFHTKRLWSAGALGRGTMMTVRTCAGGGLEGAKRNEHEQMLSRLGSRVTEGGGSGGSPAGR